VLLAKSTPPVGLRQHTRDVLLALTELRAIWPEIPACIDKAAIFHDVGKAALMDDVDETLAPQSLPAPLP